MIKIGADPEVFITDHKEKIISVEGLLGGTKEKPLVLNGFEKGCAVQEDNVLGEFNIPACKNDKEFVYYNQIMKNRIINIIRENTGKQYGIAIKASHKFKRNQLVTEQALVFGCDPDLNVWTMEQNQAPNEDSLIRSAGGHVHLGWTGDISLETQINVGMWADYFLGLESIFIDKDSRRRSLYGKAGSIRFKPYGIEYRTLSNYWLRDKLSMTNVYRAAVLAIQLGLSKDFPIKYGDDIQNIINNGLIDDASSIKKEIV